MKSKQGCAPKLLVLAAGAAVMLVCSCSRIQQPSEAQVRSIVKEEIASEREKQASATISQLLSTPESQKYLQEHIKRLLQGPELQKTLQDQMKSLFETPEIRKALQEAVSESITKMLQGKSSGGQGGGQSP
ncbi:MAG: hypothetical protein ACPLPR_03770 [Bacillota bacterium]